MKKIIVLLLMISGYASWCQEMDPAALDAFVDSNIKTMNIAGASVLVKQNGKVLLDKGYGFADLSTDVKASPQTAYFLVGPGMFILSACILQQIEQGKISLDDGVEKFLPDFPLQGHPVKIRHLLSSTSGIIDYHYLGDPLEATYHTPKATDEVLGLFTNRPFTSDVPGTRWDWSISNFALLESILEKVTNMSYKEYLQKNIITPLGLTQTTWLEEKVIIRFLAKGYSKQGEDLYPAYKSLFTYDPSLRVATSTGDLLKIWEGVKAGKLISAKSFAMMTTPEPAARQISQTDPSLQFGYIIRLKKVGGQPAMGLHGALPGFSSHCYYFPEKDLSIVVLANTSNQYANEIGQNIALKMLGMPLPPDRDLTKKKLADEPVKTEEQKPLMGTYALKLAPDPLRHKSYNYYKRTLRVIVEHGQLQWQKLGDTQEPLLKQSDGSYAVYSSPNERIRFDIKDGKAVSITISDNGKAVSICNRVGDSDIATFHAAGLKID